MSSNSTGGNGNLNENNEFRKGFRIEVNSNGNSLRLPYHKIANLGKGTFGIVYHCKMASSGDDCAIKRIIYTDNDLVVSVDTLREIDALFSLRMCPNIITLDGVILSINSSYLVLPLYNMNLRDWMISQPRMGKFQTRTKILSDICRGMLYAHSMGFIHRDIKPTNVLVSGADNSVNAVLIDWGSSRRIIHNCGNYTPKVQTIWYRAIEVLLGNKNYNSAVDIWSLGCLAYELFTNKPLFKSDNELDAIIKIFKLLGTPEPNGIQTDTDYSMYPKFDRLGVPNGMLPQVHNFVTSCLTYNVSDRPNIVNICHNFPWLGITTDITDLSTKILSNMEDIEPKIELNPYNGNAITLKDRLDMIAWLYFILSDTNSHAKTFVQTVHYIDLFISRCSIPRSELELVAISAFYISSSINEVYSESWESCIEYLEYKTNKKVDKSYAISVCKNVVKILDGNYSYWTVADYVYHELSYSYSKIVNKISTPALLNWLFLTTTTLNEFPMNHQKTYSSAIIAIWKAVKFGIQYNIKPEHLEEVLDAIVYYTVDDPDGIADDTIEDNLDIKSVVSDELKKLPECDIIKNVLAYNARTNPVQTSSLS